MTPTAAADDPAIVMPAETVDAVDSTVVPPSRNLPDAVDPATFLPVELLLRILTFLDVETVPYDDYFTDLAWQERVTCQDLVDVSRLSRRWHELAAPLIFRTSNVSLACRGSLISLRPQFIETLNIFTFLELTSPELAMVLDGVQNCPRLSSVAVWPRETASGPDDTLKWSAFLRSLIHGLPTSWMARPFLSVPIFSARDIQILTAAARLKTHSWSGLRLRYLVDEEEDETLDLAAANAELFVDVEAGRSLKFLTIQGPYKTLPSSLFPRSAEGLATVETLCLDFYEVHEAKPFLENFLDRARALKVLVLRCVTESIIWAGKALDRRLRNATLPPLCLETFHLHGHGWHDDDAVLLLSPHLNELKSFVFVTGSLDLDRTFTSGRFSRLTRISVHLKSGYLSSGFVVAVLQAAPLLVVAYLRLTLDEFDDDAHKTTSMGATTHNARSRFWEST